MLTDCYLYQMRSNRQLEKNLSEFEHVQIQNLELYSHTIYAILQVRIFLFLMTQPIKTHFLFDVSYPQISDLCGLKKQTKYLVKKSLDTYILRFPDSTADELQFAAVNLLRLAIKSNQDPSIYDEITIEKFMSQIGPQYRREDFIEFEVQFYSKPEFGFNFTTPYDYLGLYANTFQIDSKQIKKIHFVLDFSFTIPEMMFKSAEEIFFGSMLYVFKDCFTQRAWILSQTFCQQQARNASQIIFQYYQLQVSAPSNAQFQ